MNRRIIEFRELLWQTKDEKLSFRRIKRQEIGRHPVGYVSYSVFKVSDGMREMQSCQMIREVEHHQHRGGGLLMN